MNATASAVHSATGNHEQSAAAYYRAEIDGLRGLAVLGVIGFHAFPEYFPGGFVGVDVFFVISGFLISSIILRQLQRSAFTLVDFYARRIRRILPALLVVLAACLLLGNVVLLPNELEQLGKHIGSASMFLSNFTLWRESGYFDAAAELKPLLHLWSLGIEEQFYLFWPILLLLLWPSSKKIRNSVLLLTSLSFAMCLVMAPRSATANFYLPFTRFWELGLGCLLAVAKETSGTGNHWLSDHRVLSVSNAMLPVVGIVLIALSVLLLDGQSPFPGWTALLPTVGAICIIAGHRDAWFHRHILASTPLVFIGIISYPLYLWHWPILSFAAILGAGTPEIEIRVVAILLSFALAWLTLIIVERPIRAQRASRISLTLVTGLLVFGAAGIVMYSARGFPERFGLDVEALHSEPRTNPLCPVEFRQERKFNYCKSTQVAPPSAVFLGDSRAQAVYDGVADALGARYALTLLARGGCPPLLGVDLHYADQRGCSEVWKTFIKYVETVKPRVVVLVGGGYALLDPAVAKLASGGGHFSTHEEAFEEGLRRLITALGKVSHVVYIRELPRFKSGPSCFLRPIGLPGSHCAPLIPRSAATPPAFERILLQLQREVPRLQLVDSAAALCDAAGCSQRLPSGVIIYSDPLHLSPAGGRYFAHSSGLLGLIENKLVTTAAPDFEVGSHSQQRSNWAMTQPSDSGLESATPPFRTSSSQRPSGS